MSFRKASIPTTYTKTSLVAAFSSTEQEAYKACRFLRQKADPILQQSTIPLIEGNEVFKTYCNGILFPTKTNDIWQRLSPIEINNTKKALSWILSLLISSKLKINRHVTIRNLVIKAALFGKWKIVNELVKIHEDELGCSLWSITWRILSSEENHGSAYRAELVNDLTNEANGPFVCFFSRVYGLSVDKSLPEESFRQTIEQYILGVGQPYKSFFELLCFESVDDDYSLSEMLALIEGLPLVDRYETILRLTLVLFKESHPDLPRVRYFLEELSSNISDANLSYATEILSVGENSGIHGSQILFQLWNSYLKSDYQKVLSEASVYLSEDPSILGVYEMLAKSYLYLKAEINPSDPNISSLIEGHLLNVFKKNEKSDDSLNYLSRLASRVRIFSLSNPLRAFVENHSTSTVEVFYAKQAAVSQTNHGPRNLFYSHSVFEELEYLNKSPDNLSSRFFTDILNDPRCLRDSSIPELRYLFFGGLAAAKLNKLGIANDLLSEFIEKQGSDEGHPLSPFAIEEALRELVKINIKTGSLENAQKYLVSCYIRRAGAIKRLPTRYLFDACTEISEICSRHIEYPILAYLTCDNPHEISIALKRFMRHNNITTPFSVVDAYKGDNDLLSIFLLRVCSIEVIDSIGTLDSATKVETHRLSILNWLANNSTNWSRASKQEILRLTQTIQLRDALNTIEGARVIVNTTALREAQEDRFKEIYYRFAAQRELVDSFTKDVLSQVHNQIQILGKNRGVVSISIDKGIPIAEASQKTFEIAFRTVRDAFLYSPHFGVEACLSGKIRHGIIIQHIRKAFVERKLTVSEDAAGQLECREYWATKLNLLPGDRILDEVLKILVNLTSELNKAAEEVKDIWLQSKTEDKNPESLFDFSFSREQLKGITLDRTYESLSFDEFIDSVFEHLLERTKSSLKVVKQRIRNDLSTKLQGIIDEALLELQSNGELAQCIYLRNELIQSKQHTESMCKQMERWFQDTDVTVIGDSGFDLIARTAAGMVERLNPNYSGKHDFTIRSQARIRGRLFTSFVHLIFFLLENAIKHSDVPANEFSTGILIEDNNNILSIQVIHKMQNDLSAKTAKTKVETALEILKSQSQSQMDASIREGGSGFAKIFATVRYEFKQEVEMLVSSGDDKLILLLSFPFVDLTA